MNTTTNVETLNQTEIKAAAGSAECAMGSAECGKEKELRADFLGWEGLKRRGKVARLSLELREELNTRLENGEEAKPLLEWLNNLPEVKALLQEQFGGAPLTKQNLSEWRQGGFREWLVRRQLAGQAEDLTECAFEIESQSEGLLVDHLATVVAARDAGLLADWDGEATEAFAAKAKVLRGLCQDVVRLQRSMHRAAEQALKMEAMREKQAARAEQREKAQRLAPILSAMRNRSLAAALGGGKAAEQVASVINAVQHGTPAEECEVSGLKFQAAGKEVEAGEEKLKSQNVKGKSADRRTPAPAESPGQSNLVQPGQGEAGEFPGAEGTC